MSRKSPPYIEGMTSLKVGNISYSTRCVDLHRSFSRFGPVGDIYIPRDKYTNNSRGFGFVRFYDKRDAEDALDAMDGRMLDGRELRVQMARYGRPASPHRSSRRGRGRRSRSRSRSRSRRRSRSRSRSRRRSHSRGSRSRSASKSSRGKSKSKSRSRSKASDRSRSRSK